MSDVSDGAESPLRLLWPLTAHCSLWDSVEWPLYCTVTVQSLYSHLATLWSLNYLVTTPREQSADIYQLLLFTPPQSHSLTV